MPEPVKVCCGTCGFFAARKFRYPGAEDVGIPENVQSDYLRVDEDARANGAVFGMFTQETNWHFDTSPACFRGCRDIAGEVATTTKIAKDKSAVKAYLTIENNCPKHMPFVTGMPPEWHLREWRMNELEQRAKEFVRLQEQDRRNWEKHFQTQLDQNRSGIERAGLILGAAGIIVGVLLATPDSIAYKAIVAVWNWIAGFFN